MINIEYNRQDAVNYANRWALSRNPEYYDYSNIGGDCTNFASQCIFAGAGVMNYTPVLGWYYITANERTASWTGVEYLYDFLVNNKGIGPYAREVPRQQAQIGDVVQLGRKNGDFYHTPVIIATEPRILVAAHSYDVLDKPLDSYNAAVYRFLHIEGVRVQ